jgi:hypothetical protein
MREALYMLGVALGATWWYAQRRLALLLLDVGAEWERLTR